MATHLVVSTISGDPVVQTKRSLFKTYRNATGLVPLIIKALSLMEEEPPLVDIIKDMCPPSPEGVVRKIQEYIEGGGLEFEEFRDCFFEVEKATIIDNSLLFATKEMIETLRGSNEFKSYLVGLTFTETPIV